MSVNTAINFSKVAAPIYTLTSILEFQLLHIFDSCFTHWPVDTVVSFLKPLLYIYVSSLFKLVLENRTNILLKTNWFILCEVKFLERGQMIKSTVKLSNKCWR